jgi:hypothetical protein
MMRMSSWEVDGSLTYLLVRRHRGGMSFAYRNTPFSRFMSLLGVCTYELS